MYDAARYLFGQQRALEKVGDEEADDFEDVAYQARLSFDDEDVSLDEKGRWTKLARGLIDALTWGLDPRLARQVLAWDRGIDVRLEDVERYWNLLIDFLRDPSWSVKEDKTFSFVQERLGCDDNELAQSLLGETEASGKAALRNLLLGRTKSREAFEKLRSICRNAYWAEKLSVGSGSRQLFWDFFSAPVLSNIGRVRMVLALSEARTLAHVDLAEDVMKAVLFGLVAAGFEPVAWAGEEFVVQVADDSALEDECDRVAKVAQEAAQRVVPAVPLPCQASHVQVW